MTEQEGTEGEGGQVFLIYHLTDLRAAAVQDREHNYERLDAKRDHVKAAALFMEPSQKTGYKLVARVTAADVDAVSFLTTNVDRPWWLNDGVEAFAQRSAGTKSVCFPKKLTLLDALTLRST